MELKSRVCFPPERHETVTGVDMGEAREPVARREYIIVKDLEDKYGFTMHGCPIVHLGNEHGPEGWKGGR